jgi:hypothetical protein
MKCLALRRPVFLCRLSRCGLLRRRPSIVSAVVHDVEILTHFVQEMSSNKDSTSSVSLLNVVPNISARKWVQATRCLIDTADIRSTNERNSKLKLSHLASTESLCRCFKFVQQIAFYENIVIVHSRIVKRSGLEFPPNFDVLLDCEVLPEDLE